MLGFTFNGLHCERDLKLKYAPTEDERAGFFAKYDIQSTDYETKDGGVYYNSRKKELEFDLPCFYEEISRKEREAILMWMECSEIGDLMFDDRPYCYYHNAVVSAPPTIKEWPVATKDGKRYSGIVTVHLVSYYPNAYLVSNTAETDDNTGLYEATGAIPAALMPAAPTTSDPYFLVYNPGTKVSGLTIRIAGSTGEDEVTLHSETTNQTCTVKRLTDA